MNTASSPTPLLTPARRREIARLAEAIARRYFPRGAVDPEQIALQEGIVVAYSSLPEAIDGMLLFEGGKFILVGNERRAARGSSRQRFTFAHELGHYFLKDHREALVQERAAAARAPHPGNRGRLFEQEADVFAASLLMPELSFREAALASTAEGLELIEELAKEFMTSITSTAYRAIELDLFVAPAAVLLWDNTGQPVGRRWSVETLLLGDEYYALAEIPPPGSRTAGAIKHLRPGKRLGAANRMDWFIDVSGYYPRDFESLTEEVMSLGFHGWMTLLHAGRNDQPLSGGEAEGTDPIS
jgi:Zn-dependent peptidase ImmA (M78 family)